MRSYTGHVRGLAALVRADRAARRADPRRGAGSHRRRCSTAGSEPNTARLRLASLRAFARWLADEDEIDADPLIGMRPPKLDHQGHRGADRRPAAAAAQGVRGQDAAGPPRRGHRAADGSKPGCAQAKSIALQTTDLDLAARAGHRAPRQGRQGPDRPVRPQTAAALDRYLRARRSHRLADSAGAVGRGGRQGDSATTGSTTRCATGPAPPVSRASTCICCGTPRPPAGCAAGGSEQGLMAVAGWSTRVDDRPLHRGQRSERAAAEARSLGLGEL